MGDLDDTGDEVSLSRDLVIILAANWSMKRPRAGRYNQATIGPQLARVMLRNRRPASQPSTRLRRRPAPMSIGPMLTLGTLPG